MAYSKEMVTFRKCVLTVWGMQHVGHGKLLGYDPKDVLREVEKVWAGGERRYPYEVRKRVLDWAECATHTPDVLYRTDQPHEKGDKLCRDCRLNVICPIYGNLL